MPITREDVESRLEEVRDRADHKGVRTTGDVEEVWRGCKRCFFCNRASEDLSCAMVHLDAGMALPLPGPSDEHGRLYWFGLCTKHIELVRDNPEQWTGKLDRMLKTALAAEVQQSAGQN